MHLRTIVPFATLALLAASVASCSGVVTTPQPAAPASPSSCLPPRCVALTPTLESVALPAVNGATAVAVSVAGSGFVELRDSSKPFGGSPPLLVALTDDAAAVPVLYIEITAINGSATLTKIPGVRLEFLRVPPGTLRLAVLDKGVWTTVGKPGVANGKTITFAATDVHPPIHLDRAKSYELGLYLGGVLPPSPSPSPSPSPTPSPSPSPSPSPTPTAPPGAFSVTVACAQSTDACSSGTTSTAGSVQFTAVGDTATLTPHESPATTFTLKSDTCNRTDDPAAGGNWATFSPAAGQAGSSFVVTAIAAGASGKTANCSATIADAHGQTVKVNVEVTLGSIGINKQ